MFNNLDYILLSVSLYKLNGMMLILACLMLFSPDDGERPEAVADEKHPTGVWNGDTVAERRGRCVGAAFLFGLRQIKIRNHILSVGYVSGTSSPGSSFVWTEEMGQTVRPARRREKAETAVMRLMASYVIMFFSMMVMVCIVHQQ